MFLEDLGFLGFDSCFQRTKGSGSWLMFSKDQGFFGFWLMFLEDQRFWILAYVFRGPRIFGLCLMFLEDRRFGILAYVFRGLRVSRSWLMFSEDLGFLGFGSCFQRSKGLGSWLGSCFQRTWDFWALAHVFRGPKVWDLGSCF